MHTGYVLYRALILSFSKTGSHVDVLIVTWCSGGMMSFPIELMFPDISIEAILVSGEYIIFIKNVKS